jgi:ATP/maltotriose-dependent transcriptional regulator MalT
VSEPAAELDRARRAITRQAWAEAYEGFRSADPSALAPADLERLADAAWWLSHADEAVATWQRAYAGYAAAGQDPEAAFVAVRLMFEHFERGEPSVAMGWLMRAGRHLQDHEECVQHGYLAMGRCAVAQTQGDVEEATALAGEVLRIGQRFGDRSLVPLAIHMQGILLIGQGSVADGFALLDEAMTSVISGELSPLYTGVIYCRVLDACLGVDDLRRAAEWNAAALAWCASLVPDPPFTRLCRIHRAHIATLRGAWAEAEVEARRVLDDGRIDPEATARAWYEAGEIRRRSGDLAGAEEAFGRAGELGLDPQPGMALVRLAQGNSASALKALRVAADGEQANRLVRARLLAALVDVALAADDLATAREACRELDAIARDYGTPALDATAAMATGGIRLAEGDAGGAVERLRHARAVWQELRLPYESAVARLRHAIAVRAAGDEEDARLELRAALGAFERLGATLDAAAAAELLGDRPALPRGLTAREAEVLRLVAAGKSNRDIAPSS